MKTIQILCGCLILLAAGCSKEKEEPIGGRGKSSAFMEVVFVDQDGNNYLLDNIVTSPDDKDKFFMSIDKSLYTMRQFADGVEIDITERPDVMTARPIFGGILFNSRVPLTTMESQYDEVIVVYEMKFSFPKLFGDEKEHTLTVLRKNKNWGYLNNLEHLLFDGKVVVSNSDWDPVTIVVPTAQ